jgi:MoaA/NifB/PqqE/SkfB family radical SAM enzyme
MSLTCTAPWNGLFVWTDGTVSYCGRLRATGDLRRQTFAEFWNSLPLQNARSYFLQDRLLQSGCPATCCWLTAKKPNLFIKYFDEAPSAQSVEEGVQPPVQSCSLPRPPRSRVENSDRIAREIEAGSTVTSGFPTSLSISVTNYCSLRCPMCCFGIIPPEQKKPTARLVDPVVLARLKAVYPYLTRLDLIGGELFDIPFTDNPLVQILEDVASANASEIGVTITTNGQHLSPTWAEYLIRYPFVDIVAFSVDSFDPNVYARTRINGSLERVMRSIKNIQAAKASRGVSYPIIRLNMIIGAHTCTGIPLFIENARALNVDEIEFQKLVQMGKPEFFVDNNLFQPKHADKLFRLWHDLAKHDFRSNRDELIGMIQAYLGHLGFEGFEYRGAPGHEVSYALPPRDMEPEKGHCWVARLPALGPSDNLSHPSRSYVRLVEDLKPLGPGHSLHDDIRQYGDGRFSHWDGALYFSTSDHADPRSSPHQYHLKVPGAAFLDHHKMSRMDQGRPR